MLITIYGNSHFTTEKERFLTKQLTKNYENDRNRRMTEIEMAIMIIFSLIVMIILLLIVIIAM